MSPFADNAGNTDKFRNSHLITGCSNPISGGASGWGSAAVYRGALGKSKIAVDFLTGTAGFNAGWFLLILPFCV